MPPERGSKQKCKKCGQLRKGHVCTAIPSSTQLSEAIPMNTTAVVIEDDLLGDPNVSSTSNMDDLFGSPNSSHDEEENLPLTKRKERKRVKDEDSSEDEGNESTIKEKPDNVPTVS